MVDNLNTTPVEASEGDSGVLTAARSDQGQSKVVVGVIAALALLAVLAVLGFLYMSSASDPTVPVQTPTGATAEAPADSGEAPVEPAKPELSRTFAFRNIFAPSVKAPPPPSTDDADGDGADGTSDDVVDAAPNELVLVSIQTTDGEATATFAWNGQTYVLAEGESIPDSPWKVITIGTDSVTVIYGDSSPIEITVGGSISK